jgi:protein O-GlcNAc transferase
MSATHSFSDLLAAAAARRAAAGDVQGAITLLDEALIQDPRHALAARLLARNLIGTDPARAVATSRALLADMPDDIEILGILAQALSALGDTGETVAIFAHAVSRAPEDAGLHCNLSLALLRAGQPRESAAAARQAIALDPTLAEAHANLGHALNGSRELDAAMAAFTACLAVRPEHPDALLGIAVTQMYLGKPSAAVLALRRAEASSPAQAAIQTDLASALQALGSHEDALRGHRRAMALAPWMALCGSNLLMAMQYGPHITEAEALTEAQEWGVRASGVARVVRGPVDRDPERKLRIGYVSADFWSHPVGFLGGGAITRHDRRDFSVIAYANQTITDRITTEIASGVDIWRPIPGMGDEAVARQIVADGIDILVDLSGHTGGNRLGVFARRPAPLQLSWLGYFATTGLPAIDAILLDDEHLADKGEAQFSEQVIRLPMGRFCYTPPPETPDPAPAPSEVLGHVIFGSFNNPAKLNGDTLDLWARVLEAVPDSRLVLKWRSLIDPILSARILGQFSIRGIAADRIVLEGAEPHDALLAAYGRIDVALDPMPFTGALTTCEALWMGVPVVTLPGRRAVSRQTHAILARIGMSRWSARDRDDYVAIASGLAADLATRSEMRTGLRAMMRASPLCDPAGFVTGLERVYRGLWRDWCRTA